MMGMLINSKALQLGNRAGEGGAKLTIDAAQLVTHVLAVIFTVTLAVPVDAGAIQTLELIGPAGGHRWRGQSGDCHKKHQAEIFSALVQVA